MSDRREQPLPPRHFPYSQPAQVPKHKLTTEELRKILAGRSTGPDQTIPLILVALKAAGVIE